MRLLRSASLAASTRVTNPECLLRSADIMAAVAARFNSVRETSSRYGRVGFSLFLRMYAEPFRVLRSALPFFIAAEILLRPGTTRYADFGKFVFTTSAVAADFLSPL